MALILQLRRVKESTAHTSAAKLGFFHLAKLSPPRLISNLAKPLNCFRLTDEPQTYEPYQNSAVEKTIPTVEAAQTGLVGDYCKVAAKSAESRDVRVLELDNGDEGLQVAAHRKAWGQP